MRADSETSFVNPLPQLFKTENDHEMIAYTMLDEKESFPCIYIYDLKKNKN